MGLLLLYLDLVLFFKEDSFSSIGFVSNFVKFISPELQDVMHCAYQFPFTDACLKPPPHEAVKVKYFFYMTKHWLYRYTPLAVQLFALLRLKLVLHEISSVGPHLGPVYRYRI